MASNAAVPISLGYDPDMGVPLAGQEGYRPKGSGDGFIDERFGGLDDRGSGTGSKDLKAFLEVATRPPESIVHVLDEKFRVYFDSGKWHGVGVANGLKHHLTSPDRDGLLSKLAALAGRVQREAIHDLTRSQEIEVARLCQSGKPGEGIALYLEYRLGTERARRYDNGSEMVNDTELQPVMEDCAYFCWISSRPDVQDSPGFRDFVQDYAGTRPLNFDVLSEAYKAWGPHQEKQRRAVAAARFGKQEEPTAAEIAEGLENMTDEQVQEQFWAVARAAR